MISHASPNMPGRVAGSGVDIGVGEEDGDVLLQVAYDVGEGVLSATLDASLSLSSSSHTLVDDPLSVRCSLSRPTPGWALTSYQALARRESAGRPISARAKSGASHLPESSH
jgi:hypothetical protein